MKINLNIKKISIVPIFAGLIFAGILGIRTANNSNHFVSNPNEKQNGSYTENKEHISQLIMGGYHSSALTNKGNVYTWGSNFDGQLGDGSGIKKDNPTKITDKFNLSGDEHITQLSMGKEHSSALTNWGNVYTWGQNDYGQLGDGTRENKNTPTKITDNFNLFGDEKITQLSLGGEHSSALTNKGNLYTWGRNGYGQLGDGSRDNWIINPTKITDKFNLSGDEKITQLSLSGDHSTALTNEGNVYTWGYNYFGQLGDGSTDNKHTPTKITDNFNLSDKEKITQLSLGGYHSFALTNKGNVYTWGYGLYGQLGDGTNINKNTPTKITEKFNLSGDEKITQLSMGQDHSSALTNEGNVYTWGYNYYGQLGGGTRENKNIPTKITDNFNLSDKEKITQLSLGQDHSSALTNEGNVYTWGRIDHGQLGRKSTDGNISNKYPGIVDIINFSSVTSVTVTNKTYDSVTINFIVNKNDESGNVVIKDKTGAEKDTSNVPDGQNSITIDNLESNTIFTGWTIEVDGNGPVEIPEFKTHPFNSEIFFDSISNETSDSATINFIVTKNYQSGNVVIKDETGAEKDARNVPDGQNSITIDNLESNTTFTGWTIEVDGNGKVPIEEFKTLPFKSEVEFDNITNITHNSVTINFNVTKNYQSGNVVIKDKDGVEKATGKGFDGKGSIIIKGLKSKTTFTGWTIEADGNGKVPIEDFKTKKYTSNDIENNLDLNIKGEIKSSDKEITLIYESNQQLNGIYQHTITYKNGKEQITSSSNGKYSVNNTIEETYSLHQSIKNIEKIETTYEVDGYIVSLDSYTGSADKVLGIKETQPGLSPGAITGIVLGSITGVLLIVLMIYFLTKKNRTKAQSY